MESKSRRNENEEMAKVEAEQERGEVAEIVESARLRWRMSE